MKGFHGEKKEVENLFLWGFHIKADRSCLQSSRKDFSTGEGPMLCFSNTCLRFTAVMRSIASREILFFTQERFFFLADIQKYDMV